MLFSRPGLLHPPARPPDIPEDQLLPTAFPGRSEVAVFREAHAAWYGQPPSAAQLDRLMGDYLVRSALPFFVRHHCREQIARHPSLPAIRAQRLRRSRRVSLLILLALALAVTGALLLA